MIETAKGPREPRPQRERTAQSKRSGSKRSARVDAALLPKQDGLDRAPPPVVQDPSDVPRKVRVAAEPPRPLGSNPATWLPDAHFVEGISDAAVRALAPLYQQAQLTDLTSLPAAGPLFLDEARLFARFKELRIKGFSISDLQALSARLPQDAEGASVLLRLAAAYRVDPKALRFADQPLEGAEVLQGYAREPLELPAPPVEPSGPLTTEPAEFTPSVEPEPAGPLGDEPLRGPTTQWTLHPADKDLAAACERLKQAGLTRFPPPSPIPAQQAYELAGLWVRARELGVETPGPLYPGSVLEALPDTPEGKARALRICAAYGTAPGAMNAKLPESVRPIGQTALPDEAIRSAVDSLKQSPSLSKLEHWTAHPFGTPTSTLGAVRFWARAKELGLEGLAEPAWDKLLAELPKLPSTLAALRRLAAAYGKDPDEVVPFAPGRPVLPEPAEPLGRDSQDLSVNEVAARPSDRALENVFAVIGRFRWKLPQNFSNPQDPGQLYRAVGCWARGRELGVKGVEKPDVQAVAAAMEDTPRSAARLLRLCKAFGVDASGIDFHGRPLPEVCTLPPRWATLFEETQGAEAALAKLDKLVGLREVKESVRRTQRQLELNAVREKMGLATDMASMHAEFLGNPGTGKTTVARIYGEILYALGRVKEPGFVELSRADLVAGFQGQTAPKTLEALQEGKGGVIFIDEAYALKEGDRDEFGQEAIDTLIAFMENNRDDTVVILAGYPKEMQRLKEANPGLFSRITQHITFENYDDEALAAILQGMVADRGYTADADDVKLAARNVGRKRKRPDFANARDVRNTVEAAILRQSERLGEVGRKVDPIVRAEWLQRLSREDLLGDNAWTPERAKEVLSKLDAAIGLEDAKAFIRDIRALVATNRMREDARLPVVPVALHSAFLGAPGTGKTLLARLYAQVLACEGALSSGHLIETDRAGLVAEYVGQTAQKTLKVLERARGGVLFIDEAYALASGGSGGNDFGKEAVDTIVKFMEDNRDDIVVVFAGYPGDMEKLFALNPGLRSRVGHEVFFQDYGDGELGEIAQQQAGDMGYRLSAELAAAIGAKVGQGRGQQAFANGRSSRNAVEAAVLAQARRLQEAFDKTGQTPGRDALMELLPQDFGIQNA